MGKLVVSFEKNGEHLPVTSFTKSGGSEFGSEKLARGRRVRIAYGWPSTQTTRGKIAKEAIRKYQRKLGLEAGDLNLRVVRNARGNLVISGIRKLRREEKYAPKLDDTRGRYFVDLDIDLGVVERDLLGAFTHFGELIVPGRTNHLDVGKKLARQKATKDLIYYRVKT